MTERKLHAVGALSDFPAGEFILRNVDGQDVGIVKLRSGEFRAIRNYCPHKGAPICRGKIGGTWPPVAPGDLKYDREGEVLVCPWHGFEYDLQTGREMFGTGLTRLRMFTVQIIDGEIYVAV